MALTRKGSLGQLRLEQNVMAVALRGSAEGTHGQ